MIALPKTLGAPFMTRFLRHEWDNTNPRAPEPALSLSKGLASETWERKPPEPAQ
jgi:hypothetical protein